VFPSDTILNENDAIKAAHDALNRSVISPQESLLFIQICGIIVTARFLIKKHCGQAIYNWRLDPTFVVWGLDLKFKSARVGI
jgi:hypothetical protein